MLSAFALLTTLALGDAPDAGAPVCAIDVTVKNLREGGLVWVFLFSDADPKAYPTKRDRALKRLDVAPKAGLASVAFEGLACGTYAIAVVHDENGDGKLATGIFGIPVEGLGGSRDAKGFMGPPGFDAAKLTFKDARTPVAITVNY